MTYGPEHREHRSAVPPLALMFMVVACVGATGLTQRLVFAEPSTLKYVLTVTGPGIAALFVVATDRLAIAMVGLILAAPFGSYGFIVAGQPVQLLWILALVVFVVAASEPAAATGRFGRVQILSALLIACLTVSVWRSTQPSVVVPLFLTLATVAYAASHYSRTRANNTALVLALIASGSLQGALAIFEYVTGRTLSLYSSSAASGSYSSDYFFSLGGGARRATAAFYDPLSLGNVLCLILPFAIIYLTTGIVDKSVTRIALGATACALQLGGLTVTFSRASWIAFVVSTIVLTLIVGKSFRPALMIVSATAVLGIGSIFSAVGPVARARALSILDPTNPTVATSDGDLLRESLWRAGWHTVEQYPVWGVGLGNVVPYLARQVGGVSLTSHTHSTYLQVASEVGVPALGLLLTIVGVALSRSVRACRRPSQTENFAAPVVAALVAMIVVWITDYTIRYATVGVFMVTVVILGASIGRMHGRTRSGSLEDPALFESGSVSSE